MLDPTPRPTLEMVAAEAGVSRGTASRALNGERHVSAHAQRAVLEAADRLGYRPNLVARSLALGRSGSVALVVSETEDRLFQDPFFAGLAHGVHAELATTDVALVLSLARLASDRDKLVRYAAGGHVDGVLLVSLHDPDPLPAALARTGIPVVQAGRPVSPQVPVSHVDADNRGGARLATERLLGAGRRRVVTICGPLDMVAARDRLDGWEDALRAGRRRVRRGDAEVGGFSEAGGHAAMTALLERAPDLDAVFAASDLMALGALRALREAGRRVPDDVAVIGFDDVEAAAHSDPPLTTVAQPLAEMGRLMVRMLLGRLADEGLGEEPASRVEPGPDGGVVVPTTLVERVSG